MSGKQPTAMPQDPNLYGQPPPKKQKKSMPLSTSLDFTSQLTSLLAAPSAPHGRSRPSKSKTDSLFSAKVKRKPGARKPNDDPDPTKKLTLKDPTTTEEEKSALAAARRKMEEKARLYAAMKRGDYVPGREGEAAPLVDFDRKWAEEQAKGAAASASEDDDHHPSSSSDEDKASAKKPEELVEYEDEFGRLRTATRAAHAAHLRRLARGTYASAELEGMSARPAAPDGLMYGAAVQAAAFAAADPDRMEELAGKRDRSATPPEEKHYDARGEIRSRGTGFYAFGEGEGRREAMRGLEGERRETERVRRERVVEVGERRRVVEERRRVVEERRAGKLADAFLERLGDKWAAKGVEIGAEEGAGGGGNIDGPGS